MIQNSLKGMIVAFAVTMICGCGSSGEELGVVRGVVMHDGKPVPKASIEFLPVAGGRPSLALSNDAGEYEAYYLPGEQGAKIGEHTIRFEFAKSEPGEGDPVKPKGRGKGGGTKLVMKPETITVASGTNEIDFELVEE